MDESEYRLTRVGDVKLESAGSAFARLAPATVRALVNLRGRPDDAGFVEAVESVLGAGLPEAPNRWTGSDETAIVWLGPDEWLVMACRGQAGEIEDRLRELRPDDPWLSMADVSHNYTGFILTGSKWREVIAKGCPLDLHPRVFGQGDCAQSLLARSRVLLRCVDDGDSVEIWVRNSFARYVAAWLMDALQEYGD